MAPVPLPTRVIHFVGEGVFSPVLDSQVLAPLRVLGDAAPQTQRALLILTGSRHRRGGKVEPRLKEIAHALPGVKLSHRYRPWGGVPFEHRLWARKLRTGIEEVGYDGGEPIVVHCRGEWTAAAAATLKRSDPRIRILLDLRGAQEAEIVGQGLGSMYFRWRSRRTTAMALAGADAINTVSLRLAEYLRSKGPLTRDLPSSVIGGCVDPKRFYFDPARRAEQRERLNLNDKFVVCYCGGLWHWQRPDAVAEAFAAIHAAMPDAHMLVISRQAESFLAHLERAGVAPESLTARAVPHDQVASYLMAADVGLLLREDHLLNRVAAPVKFAEYLRCGLPVLLTPCIGDYGQFVSDEGVGAAVGFPIRRDEVAQAARWLRQRLATEGDAYRRACSQAAEKQFSWQSQITKLIDIYRMLAS